MQIPTLRAVVRDRFCTRSSIRMIGLCGGRSVMVITPLFRRFLSLHPLYRLGPAALLVCGCRCLHEMCMALRHHDSAG